MSVITDHRIHGAVNRVGNRQAIGLVELRLVKLTALRDRLALLFRLFLYRIDTDRRIEDRHGFLHEDIRIHPARIGHKGNLAAGKRGGCNETGDRAQNPTKRFG